MSRFMRNVHWLAIAFHGLIGLPFACFGYAITEGYWFFGLFACWEVGFGMYSTHKLRADRKRGVEV